MRVKDAKIFGSFDAERNPCSPDDPECRITLQQITVVWKWKPSKANRRWLVECVKIPDGTIWKGGTRPKYVAHLIPKWADYSSASLIYEFCASKCKLADGLPMCRTHSDMLYLNLLRWLARNRVVGGWKYRPQLAIAEAVYIACVEYAGIDWTDHEHSAHE